MRKTNLDKLIFPLIEYRILGLNFSKEQTILNVSL
jgi:hypothetical protein